MTSVFKVINDIKVNISNVYVNIIIKIILKGLKTNNTRIPLNKR